MKDNNQWGSLIDILYGGKGRQDVRMHALKGGTPYFFESKGSQKLRK